MIAKVGLDLNISAQKIAELLDISRASVYRYSNEATLEDLRQFETEIKTLFNSKIQILMAKILKKFDQAIDDEWDTRNLSLAFKVISEKL